MGCCSSDPPDPPDYAGAARETAIADIETLEARKKLDRLARLGEKGRIKYRTSSGTNRYSTVDFTGIGDIDLSRADLDYYIESADRIAEAGLESAEKYGVAVVEQRRRELEAADPEGFKMRQDMAKKIMEGPEKYFTQAAEAAIQGTRGAQAARGNLFGNAPSVQEAMAVGDVGYRMYQQQLANMGAFGAGVTPTAQFGQLSGAQQGAAAFQGTGIQQSNVGVMSNNQFAQAAGNVYSNQMSYYQQQASQGSPFSQVAGMAAGLGLTALTGGAAGMAGGIGFGKGVGNIFGVTVPT